MVDALGEEMSAIFLVEFNTKKKDFNLTNALAKKVVLYALSNNFAVSFNDNSAKALMNDRIENTLVISDSFLYRHADDILDVTDFVEEAEIIFKEKFIAKYLFLEGLINLLFEHEMEGVNIYISESNSNDLKEYTFIKTDVKNLLVSIYQEFIKVSNETGFTFPDIKIRVDRLNF